MSNKVLSALSNFEGGVMKALNTLGEVKAKKEQEASATDIINSASAQSQRVGLDQQQPFDSFTVPLASLPPAWAPNIATAAGVLVYNGSYVYISLNDGTTAASGGPTGTGTGITDNDITWDFFGNAVDYNSQLATTNGQPYNSSGNAIIYRKQGSHPNGKLQIDIGGRLQDFSPGDRIVGFFNRFTLYQSVNSAQEGFAQLVIEKHIDSHFYEGIEAEGQQTRAVNLVGNIDLHEFIYLAAPGNTGYTDPTGGGPLQAQFRISGWRKIRLYIDMHPFNNDGSNWTTVDLEPWVSFDKVSSAGMKWAVQVNDGATMTVADSNAGNSRYRILDYEVSGDGYMFLNQVNGDGVAVGGISIAVQGIRGNE